MDVVKIHKDFNRSVIPFYQEKALDLFSEITQVWNSTEDFEPITYDLSGFKKTLNLEGSHNNEYFQKFILQFVKDTTLNYVIGDKTITGNAFTIVQDRGKNTFTIYINDRLKDFMYDKKDVELMIKAKRNEKLTHQELAKYEENKQKYDNLMLYSKAEMYGISGKYNKRLYMLLVQFKNKGYFIMKYQQFKEILEIPNSYGQNDIDKRILGISKKELLKAGITITEIKKIKVGKSIDKIEINFEYKSLFSEIKKGFEKAHIKTTLDTHPHQSMPDEVADIGMKNLEKLKAQLKK